MQENSVPKCCYVQGVPYFLPYPCFCVITGNREKIMGHYVVEHYFLYWYNWVGVLARPGVCCPTKTIQPPRNQNISRNYLPKGKRWIIKDRDPPTAKLNILSLSPLHFSFIIWKILHICLLCICICRFLKVFRMDSLPQNQDCAHICYLYSSAII